MSVDENQIASVLLAENYISHGDLKKAQDFAKSSNVSIVSSLISNNLINKDLLGQAIAEAYRVGYVDLLRQQPSREMILRIPEELSRQYRIVVFGEDESQVRLASDNPAQPQLASLLSSLFTGKKVTVYYSLPVDVDSVFDRYRDPIIKRLAQIIANKPSSAAPEILNEIIKEAVLNKVSDIHIEPWENEATIRFRLDGILHDVCKIPRELYENIVNRIKVQSHLRIDEHFEPQDGAIKFELDNISCDLRVSIIPTLEGESVALRLLSEYVRSFILSDLGLSPANQKLLNKAFAKPFGMIITTGPTGSGKTTTLYAILKVLNRPDINITTIEDPVEYRIKGVDQIQVNSETGLTFAKGLRSIVRHDPNIILVGEIRDLETAEIAVNAALTGHLLFSTFHSNDAATAIPRLLGMGVEPFLMASTLELIVAQRLVRKICDSCRYSEALDLQNLRGNIKGIEQFFDKGEVTVYRGKGCTACEGSGFKGMTGIFEVITVGAEMESLILENPSTAQIWELAKKNGSKSLFEDGIEKVKGGETTLEELLRVAQPAEV